MLLMERLVRLDISKHQPQLLIATSEGKRRRGKTFLKTRDSFAGRLRLIILGIDPRGGTMEWIGCVKTEAEWTRFAKIR